MSDISADIALLQRLAELLQLLRERGWQTVSAVACAACQREIDDTLTGGGLVCPSGHPVHLACLRIDEELVGRCTVCGA